MTDDSWPTSCCHLSFVIERHRREVIRHSQRGRMNSILSRSIFAACGLAFALSAQAQEKFTYMTNWYAQAEHGGFYQAVATGIYKKYGLDVTIKMGGPQVNVMQLMAAGQADCIMGSSDLQM